MSTYRMYVCVLSWFDIYSLWCWSNGLQVSSVCVLSWTQYFSQLNYSNFLETLSHCDDFVPRLLALVKITGVSFDTAKVYGTASITTTPLARFLSVDSGKRTTPAAKSGRRATALKPRWVSQAVPVSRVAAVTLFVLFHSVYGKDLVHNKALEMFQCDLIKSHMGAFVQKRLRGWEPLTCTIQTCLQREIIVKKTVIKQ